MYLDSTKKRILIAIHYMEIGGAERSLLGILNAFDTTRYEVDLFLYNHIGEFMSLIPDKIKILKEERKYTTIERSLKQVFKEGCLDIVCARLVAKWACKRHQSCSCPGGDYSEFQYVSNYTTPLLPSLSKYGEYDLAVSFLTPHNIVLEKVRAKKKIAWIHTDYSTIKVNRELELEIWNKYDYLASISASVTTAFLQLFPEVKNKIVLIENILSPSFVRQQALLEDVSGEMVVPGETVRLCSVGRFSDAKNFDNIPWICKIILERGVFIKWFIVGYGGEEAFIRKNIHQAGVEESVILLGKKINPYPYIQACDLYVQPSRYEGKAVTVREAQMLGKPVIITNFPTAKSQLNDGFDGVIVPMDNDSVASGIIDLIHNEKKREYLIENMRRTDYGNEKEIEKIYKLIDK